MLAGVVTACSDAPSGPNITSTGSTPTTSVVGERAVPVTRVPRGNPRAVRDSLFAEFAKRPDFADQCGQLRQLHSGLADRFGCPESSGIARLPHLYTDEEIEAQLAEIAAQTDEMMAAIDAAWAEADNGASLTALQSQQQPPTPPTPPTPPNAPPPPQSPPRDCHRERGDAWGASAAAAGDAWLVGAGIVRKDPPSAWQSLTRLISSSGPRAIGAIITYVGCTRDGGGEPNDPRRPR
ncbi:MAG: hypothetical protein MUF00_02010 [Gemmatimonadaceae bacterium]|jgi:hypothetical protein|nr:hypothetical protein [Gemmatimonadaceae bacterium]